MRRLLALIIVCSAFTLAAQTLPARAANQPAGKTAVQPRKPLSVRDKWAILIGVNRYKDPILPPLKYAEKNVVDLSRVLVDPSAGRFAPDHVQSITGGGASKARFNELVETWLYKKVLPADMVVVYASTHVADNPSTGEAFLCLRDSMANDPATGVPLLDFFKQVKQRTQANNILVLLDTSYGGTAAADDKTLKALSDMGVSVIAATNIGGQSYEDATTQNSFFTQQLMEGIKAGGGQLPLKTVATHIKDTVSTKVQQSLNKAQTPVFLPASHLTDDQLSPIGIEPKAQSQAAAFGFGHPVDQLGLTRPDLVMPRAGGKPVQLPPPAPTKAAADEDEDDDDGVDHSLDMRPYIAKMKSDIQKKWVPPKGLENRKLTTVFTIMRDGSIVSPTVVESSGQPDVDKSAMDALKAASPLDPLPKGAPRSVDIKYQFDWNITRGSAGGN